MEGPEIHTFFKCSSK